MVWPMLDEKAQKKQSRRMLDLERQAQLKRDDFVKAALTRPEGREYIYWLIEICQLGHNAFTANALTTSFRCGEQNVGQQIQAHIIQVAPEGYLQMLRGKEEERKNAYGTDDTDDSDGPASAND